MQWALKRDSLTESSCGGAPCVDTQIVVVLQKKEAAAFEGFLAMLIELPLLLSAELIDSLVDQRCHMGVVENDIHSAERFANGAVLGTAT